MLLFDGLWSGWRCWGRGLSLAAVTGVLCAGVLLGAGVGCDGERDRRVGPGGTGGGAGPASDEPVRVMASVYPLADLGRLVGGEMVEARWYAERGDRVTHYRTGASLPPPYMPTPAQQQPFREADLAIADGRADPWALAGLQEEAVQTGPGSGRPVIRLTDLRSSQQVESARVRGALWLDPLVMREAAGVTAEVLATHRPAHARRFEQRAARVQEEIDRAVSAWIGQEVLSQALAGDGSPAGASQERWERVVILDDEPAVLLWRLGIPYDVMPPEGGPPVPEPEAVASFARQRGASAVLLPSDWGESTAGAWGRMTGLRVVLYDPMGSSVPGDERSGMLQVISFNLRQLSALRVSD